MDLTNTQLNHIISSLQQGDEDLVVHDHPCLISFQQKDHTPDLHQHVSMVEAMDNTSTNLSSPGNTRKRGGNRASNKPNLAAGGSAGDGGEDDQTQKKMVHREIERQRRQEMSKLYASLRDLLPLEFVKGSRSISDHMHQAVHYIKKMEEKIKQLGMKRDQLKKFSDSTNESSKNDLPNTVSVSLCNEGVDILINSCPIQDNFILSTVLNALIEEGLNIMSCNITKVNDRLLHSIRSEASDLTTIDQTMLQQRLVDIANARPDFN